MTRPKSLALMASQFDSDGLVDVENHRGPGDPGGLFVDPRDRGRRRLLQVRQVGAAVVVPEGVGLEIADVGRLDRRRNDRRRRGGRLGVGHRDGEKQGCDGGGEDSPAHGPTLAAGSRTRLAHSLRVTTKRALVLAGGGLAGIAWETGVLRGIADESPTTAKALLDSDVLVGTSAGSTVAAQLGSGLGLDVLFDRQTTPSSTELNPSVGIDEITELFLAAVTGPGSKAEKLQKIGAVALSTDNSRRARAARR